MRDGSLPNYIFISYEAPLDIIKYRITQISYEKNELIYIIHVNEQNSKNSLTSKLEKAQLLKDRLISESDGEEKTYQKYLLDLAEWQDRKNSILGNTSQENSIIYYDTQIKYIQDDIHAEYSEYKQKRQNIVADIFMCKQKIAEEYTLQYKKN